MAEAHAKPHHSYHLVNPSPWPLIGAAFAFLTAVGLIMSMKGLTIGSLKLGVPLFGIGFRYGMILFIASEVMFFVAWFWAFFDASLFTGEPIQAARVAFTGGMWPPKGTEVLDPLNLPLLNTLILLTSGATVTWAHHALLHNDRQGLKVGLMLTIFLGLCFTSIQGWEYYHAPFAFSNSIYGATFFMG